MATPLDLEQLTLIADSTVDIVLTTDALLAPKFVSRSVEQLLGFTPEEARAHALMDAIHPADRPRIERLFAEVLAGRVTAEIELRIRNARTGAYLWFHAIDRRIDDESGAMCGSVVVLRDITARKTAEAVVARAKHLRNGFNDIARALDEQILEGEQRTVFLQSVCEWLVGTMGYVVAAIGLKDRDGSVRVAASAGADGTEIAEQSIGYAASAVTSCPGEAAIRTGRTQTVALAGVDGPAWVASARARGIAHVSTVPVCTPDGVLGVLCVGTHHLEEVHDEHVSCLEAFATRLGLSLQLADRNGLLALQRAAMSSSASALFITDGEGRIEWVNAAFERLSGYSANEAVGKSPSILRSDMQAPETFREMWATVRSGRQWRGELVNRRKDGVAYIVLQTVTPLLDGSGAIHLVASHEDITARRSAETLIEHLAQHDALTGLPNRTSFTRHLDGALARANAQGTRLGLLFLDLDRFKLVNDSLGHVLGDELLLVLAARIKESVREGDFLARFGSDEFMVLLAPCDDERARHVAQRILDALAQPARIAGSEVTITGSIGIALTGATTFPDAEALLRQADAAVYHAKENGRNGYAFFDGNLDHRPLSGLTIQAGLRRALARGELSLAYQPQVDAAGGELVGVEALLRWTSPELGVVSPADFIPVAEQTGISAEIDRWVLRTACAQAKAWQEQGLTIDRVAVNVSGLTLRRRTLVAWTKEALTLAGLAPERLQIELTEGVVMHDVAKVIADLNELRQLGVSVALDDFGTGYSSLSYLKRFRLDELKIDRSFVSGLPNDPDSAAIARLIVAMAKTLGMQTVAEGVETAEQAAFLNGIGCNRLQGFLFARALSPDDVVLFAARSASCHAVGAHSDAERRPGATS